jgi:hypothetical protein
VIGESGVQMVEINWVANPFRGEKFERAWRPAAEAALDYGARSYAFLKSKEDPLHFRQLAVFEDKVAFERYWLSEEISEARAAAAGLFQIPVVPEWYEVIDSATLREEAPSAG